MKIKYTARRRSNGRLLQLLNGWNRVKPVQLLPRLVNSVPICAIHYENEPLVEEKTWSDQIQDLIWSDQIKIWSDAQRRVGSCSPGCRCSNASREVESCPVHPRPEKETMIRIHYHFPTFLLSSLKLSFNLVITEECKTARFNELKSGRLPSSREPLPGWNWTQVTSNTTVSLLLRFLV